MDLRGKILAGSAAFLLIGGAALAQTAQSRQTAERIKRPDSTFITNAAEGGIAEVEMGRLAAQKGSNAAVKRFGQHMVDDHSKANEELKSVASKKGVTVPSTVNAKQNKRRPWSGSPAWTARHSIRPTWTTW